ncbi:putative GTP-binding protein EngB [Leucoagaricus sp. SymC.cos]|nr:putative GTP-binding protein EngB [Leucoagaricus sp. SymC.cos]
MLLSVSHSRVIQSLLVRERGYSNKAHRIFSDSKSAEFVAGAASASQFPKFKHRLPEVIVTGRANVGKSSLFNAVLGRNSLLHTSKKAGHTKQLNFYRVGAEPGKLVLVDAPGYGARGRPEWGQMFDEYLQTRQELRRVYILFNAKHGLNAFDAGMLEHLSRFLLTPRGTQPWTLQSIITKVDTIPADKIVAVITKIRKEIHRAAPLCLPPIVTSTEMKPPIGIDQVQDNIIDACGI